MGKILGVIKSTLLWGYARNTWQYDVLCALILAFIFLTPKAWFGTGELHNKRPQTLGAVSTIIIGRELLPEKPTTADIEQYVRTVRNRADLQVVGVHEDRDSEGKVVAYEVDIK